MHVPFAERGGTLRGLVDVATGCYPAFLFGGAVGAQLPVFHFHTEPRSWLEPRLQYLVDNGYHTVTCDEIARFVIDGVSPGPRAVALTFDDAWRNVWTDAYPLLRQHGLRATIFAIPARVGDSSGIFVSWDQLRAMRESGVIDVQSHTKWHVMMFSAPTIVDFVTPAFAEESPLNRPLMSLTTNGSARFLDPNELGAPLYVRRSRMSDALRLIPDEGAHTRCRTLVDREGREAFFKRPTWRSELAAAAGAPTGRHESEQERIDVIRDELAQGREILNAQLGGSDVRHVALPWGISGEITRSLLPATGHLTAFAERPLKRRAVRADDDRFQLMRLNGKFLTCLPGRGRQWFFTAVGGR